MVDTEVWNAAYFRLGEVYEFLRSLPEEAHKRAKANELFASWALARLLQHRAKSEHLVGFPVAPAARAEMLSDFVFRKSALDNTNFDTVIADVQNLNKAMKIQVKRYMKRKNPGTDNFFRYMCQKAQMYGDAPEVNLLFHVRVDMQFDTVRFAQLVRGVSFRVGTMTVFVEMSKSFQKCAICQVHPTFSNVWWSPVSR